jgi:hypothetical protein
MINHNVLEEIGTNAVKKLRKDKFLKGHPFMINSNELPSNQCYLEYPNGEIKLVALSSSTRDFTILRELTLIESGSIREKYKLI